MNKKLKLYSAMQHITSVHRSQLADEINKIVYSNFSMNITHISIKPSYPGHFIIVVDEEVEERG